MEPCAQDYCDRGDSPGRCVWCSVVYVVMRMHCRNHNRHSIGICYEGGLDAEGCAKDTRTEAQKISLSALVGELKERFPQALVVGHRELDPGKECPCFEMNKLRKCLEFYKKDLSLQTVKTCKT